MRLSGTEKTYLHFRPGRVMVYIVVVNFIGVSNLVGRFNKYDCIEYNTDTGALLFCNGCYFQLAMSISSLVILLFLLILVLSCND